MPRSRSLVWPAVFTLLAGALLVSLGVWQLRRLSWKEGLIAQIEARAHLPPEPLPASGEWSKLRPEDYEYRHVTARGTFDHTKEALVFRAGKELGYHLLTPMRLTSGGYVIINRGFVPADRKDQSTRLAGEIMGETVVTGLMRAPETRNLFTPPDRPQAGEYFTSDPVLIAAYSGLMPAAPFLIDADASEIPGGVPRGGTSVLALPNNHLSYALTWFSLAAALFGVFAAFAWQSRR
jgi:surfeit locus 1 family protein